MPPRHAEIDPSALLEVLERRSPRPLTIPEIARMLGMERFDRRRMRSMLEGAVARRQAQRVGKSRYRWLRPSERRTEPTAKRRRDRRPPAAVRLEGVYRRVHAGYGFVEVLGPAARRYPRDILVRNGDEGRALHGDRVEIEISGQDRRARRRMGRVLSVTRRIHDRVLGVLEKRRGRWWLLPEQELLPPFALVDGEPTGQDIGKAALARVVDAPGRPWLAAELERVVGDPEDPEVQFLAIALEHGLRIDFAGEAQADADALPSDPRREDFIGREDLRALPFVTIDGETARDFDDAVCVETHGRGGYRLRVAIADVAHYVRPGSALDAEAARRGTSVYFPDRAIPMLPRRLSNELCSLNPDRDRLVLVADMTLDRHGRRKSARFIRGVIRSHARLTYTQVAGLLSAADTNALHHERVQLAPLLPELRRMHALMKKLLANRIAGGSLDLDLPETLIDLSEEGRSIGVRLFERNDAHRIIEELMLEANRAVAERLRDEGVPFPYRIHEAPDPADVDELNAFLGAFAMQVRYEAEVEPQDVQRLLDDLRGHPLARVLSRLTLRSMKQAQYSTTNIGHFGLAFADYCHFTSPIRRYPDLLVHRQLGRCLDQEQEEANDAAESVESASVDSSQSERQAMEAERAMVDLRKAEFMLEHLLEPESGTIVSVLRFGFFVELDTYPIEGLVRVESLPPDTYRLDEKRHCLQGRRRRYRLGDRVRVHAVDVSLRRRQIDFALLEHLGPPAGTNRNGAPKRSRRRR